MWDILLKGGVWNKGWKTCQLSFLPLPGSRALLGSEPLKCTRQTLGKKRGCAYHALKSWIKGLHTIFQLFMVTDCKIFFGILTCLCLKICKGHSRDWQSAWGNGVSQILAPIAWVMLPNVMFQVSFEPVSSPDYFALTHRYTACLAGRREGVQWQAAS